MAKYPVFQMVFAEGLSGQTGLAFSTETGIPGLDLFQEPLFVVPEVEFDTGDIYYLPGELSGKRVDFELQWNNDNELFRISMPYLPYPVRFSMGFYFPDVMPWPGLSYVGKESQLVAPFKKFVMILPLDLLVMDALFEDQHACFVGLTPVFGERTDEQRNNS